MREKVLNSGLDDLCFSFDGATKGTYESLRINADFDKVLANIRGICSLKHQQDSRMRISMVCLVSTGTVIEELPKYIDMAGENGVRDVQIKQRLKHWTRPGKGGRYVIDSVSKFTDFPNHEDYLKQATNIARRRGINLSFVEDSLFDSSHPCPWPWQSLYVSAEGKIVPCCTIGIPETWSMGDLKEEKLISLWNAKEYRQLRRRMMRNEVHELCRTCYGLH
jgi:radical SAM protein with 4Fe4S-binding SPASM domain